ncbi:MAG: DUF1592 domain-containing protein [Acidobacteria bacterium]|nr:DUF1592 domain-containing protein [Acidobacteriota bacterium]MDA1233658.1 DUF1592 domain-containing protein [Acidobacteriota bacterium]
MGKRSWAIWLPALAAAASLVWIQGLPGQERNQGADFDETVQPFLASYCYSCHNDKLTTAGLDLTTFHHVASVSESPELWDKVLEKVASGKMPPGGLPEAGKEQAEAVTQWIEEALAAAGFGDQPQAGRVTARRMNRVEYNNTIRDLLGVAVRPADQFPVDDSGYGFDNIGDVLTVSPMLMEKYLQAAREVSQLAIFGAAVPDKPTKLIRLLNRRSPDAADTASVEASGTYLPYSLRGAMYGSWNFPVDGEYELRLRIANFRSEEDLLTPEERERRAEERSKRFAARAAERAANPAAPPRVRPEATPEELQARLEAARKAAPPRQLLMQVDGEPVFSTIVEGASAFGYDRGEYPIRVNLTAGEHTIRASYPELANLDDPRENINPDLRRALFVDYLDIVGPFNPSTEPPASYHKLFVCGHNPGEHGAQCARSAVQSVMERAYRRPVSESELEVKMGLVNLVQQEGDSVEEGVRLALEAILASPDFLFRIEQDGKPGASAASANVPNAERIGGYELASRLSYFLWASMPDDELFRAAKTGALHTPAGLEQQVRRMLTDAKAANLADNWAAQWLQLRNLGRTKPDPERFPTVDDELLDAMRRETNLFVKEMVREDHSILDFIDAPFTYLNGPLARHYGISGIDGEEFQRVAVDGVQRGGVLTQGAIMTVSSYPTRTSPPVRGKWVLENLLGTPPPPPPPNVPALDESKAAEVMTLRQRLQQHRQDPSCSPCHNLMDPIGFGLESYDAVGAWRTHDGEALIDTSGVLPDGKSFRGAKDLKQVLKNQSGAFTRNVTEKMLTYALGRGLERYDQPTVDDIVAQVGAHDYKFSALVMEIVESAPFQMRTLAGAQP